MKILLSGLLSLILLFSSWDGRAEGELPGAAARVHYLEDVMKSFRSMTPGEVYHLEVEAKAAFVGTCRSSDASLTLSCSTESAEKICKDAVNRAACLMVMDAFIVENLNAKRFISTAERYEMMSRGSDYRRKQAESLQHRYGSLALALSLSPAARCKADDFACLAKALEDFCQAKARKGELSYQSCAAVLAIYVGRPRNAYLNPTSEP